VFSEDEFEDTAQKVEFDPSSEDLDPDVVARWDAVIHELVDAFKDAGIESRPFI